jgi:hypothetical protein
MSLGIVSGQSVIGETPVSILTKLKTVDGPGSGLDADIVTAPVRRSSSFGGFPSVSSSIAVPIADPSATFARFTLGT